MKKYIAGFRSNTKRNKIIASIYYGFMCIIGMSGNLLTLIVYLMLPSLILNFTRILKNNEEKSENKKRFIYTLVAFIVVFIVATNLSSTKANEQNEVASSPSNQIIESKADDDVSEDIKETETNEMEQTTDKKSLEIGDKLETPLWIGEVKPVYNGVKTDIMGKYITISSSKNIKEEDLIKLKRQIADDLDGFNWIVAEFGDGTALDLGYLPYFNYCYYNYEDGFTNMMGRGIIHEDRVEYSTDL